MKEHNENFYSLEELKRARDCYEDYQDGEEVFYFVGALRYACDEIERLNKEIKELNKICSRKSHYIDKKDLEIKQKDYEIERLNNNINKGIEAINVYQNEKTLSIGYEDLKRIRGILRGNEFDLKMFEKHLKELRGDDKE